MKRSLRVAVAVIAFLMVGVVEAGCPPVPFGYTTTYKGPAVICHGEGCVSSGRPIIGQCTQSCDGSYSCWGETDCDGLNSCSTVYEYCGDCTPEYY